MANPERDRLLSMGRAQLGDGRAKEGIDSLLAALSISPDDFEVLQALGHAFLEEDEFIKAESCLIAAVACAPTLEQRANCYFITGWCNLRLRQPSRALKFYISCGRLPQRALEIFNTPALITEQDLTALADVQLDHLIELFYMAGKLEGALSLANELKARGDALKTNQTLARVLPSILRALGRHEEAGRVYVEIQRAGGLAADYRPRWADHHLARVAPEAALQLYRGDRERFAIRRPPLPVPGPALARAETLAAEPMGIDGAYLSAEVASTEAGAAYHFEYGYAPDALTFATPKQDLPPPRTAVIRQRAHRQFEWSPQCTQASWEKRRVPGDAGDRETYVLRLTGPFATDRNQLNGMGAHEMLMGIKWNRVPETPSDSLAATGGVLDLRDAAFSIVARGQDFKLNGSSLTFWAAHWLTPAKGNFGGQWALTGAPVPDAALESGDWWKTTLTIRNAPGAWTYTGNNPAEQGKHAQRYQRLPLNFILSQENHPFVLSFAMDDVRDPPNGHVEVAEFALRLRNPSLLSPASLCKLRLGPMSGDDPRKLTDGVRGYDEHLWTSAANPRFPIEFAWDMPRPVGLTHIQFVQHPYFPAKDVEVWADLANGEERCLCAKSLPALYPHAGEPPHVIEYLPPGIEIVSLKLRLLSGHYAEACGLEAFDAFGTGGILKGDGEPCSVTEELTGLEPGAPLHYRVVVTEGTRTRAGATRMLPRPADRRPVIDSAVPFVRNDGPACFLVRANAMGLPTRLWAKLKRPNGSVMTSPESDLGCQPTGRHIYLIPAGLPPEGEMCLCAENAEGATELRVTWPITATGREIAENPLVKAEPL